MNVQCVIIRERLINMTLGILVVFYDIEVRYKCFTLELPDKANAPFISCIPAGTYWMKKFNHPKKGYIFQIPDVLGRTEIQIHKGNYVVGGQVDSSGCILVGSSFLDINSDGFIDIANSKNTLAKLMRLLPETTKLTII